MADLFGYNSSPPLKAPPGPVKKQKQREDDGWPDDCFARFWAACPRRIGKLAAKKAFDRVRRSGDVSWQKLIGAVESYAAWLTERDRFWRPEPKHPATWLNQGCWDDELPEGRPLAAPRTGNGFAALHRELRMGEE